MKSRLGRLGSHPASVWTIKHIISPFDRLVVRLSRGRIPQPSSIALPTLLLTTIGIRSGQERTIPLIYVRHDDAFIVANARPEGERRNPWVANLRAAGGGRVKLRSSVLEVRAHELEGAELERWWPQLVEVWPAFAVHYAATAERAAFVLTPIEPSHA